MLQLPESGRRYEWIEKMSGLKRGLLTVLVVLVVLCATAAGGGYIWLHDYSVKKVRSIADNYSGVVKTDFKDAFINPIDKSLYIDDVKLDFAIGSNLLINRIHISDVDFGHRIPRHLRIQASGVNVPVTFMNFGSAFSTLEQMGYKSLTFDLGADYIYEDQGNRLMLKRLELDGKDTAHLNLALGLEHIKLDKPGIGGLIGTRIYSGGLVFKDHSIAGRALDYMAKERSLPKEEYIEHISNRIQMLKQTAKSRGNGYAEEFYTSLQSLIMNPSGFSLKVDPQGAVPLLYMFMGRNFDELLDLYRVKLETGNDVTALRHKN